MTFTTLHQVGVLAPTLLFQNLNLTIGETMRLGIVAKNGGGKSTLLRCITGRGEVSTGTITRSRGLRLGFVEQNIPHDLLDKELFDILNAALPIEEQAEVWRIDIMFATFGIPDEWRTRKLRELSGGWQKLAMLARAWISEPDALLLDEPTNHLDLEKIRFLENWLEENTQRMPLIIASHDRQFLDSCTTHTLFLRPGLSKLYNCPYSQARQLLEQDDATQAEKLANDIKEAQRLRKSANELKNIGINSHSDAAQKKSKQMVNRANELESKLKEPHKERSGQIRLKSSTTHNRVLLAFEDSVIRSPEGTVLFRTGKMKVFQGDRIILNGQNGTGKSCFIHHIRKALSQPANAPEIKISPNIILGYADQHMSQLPENIAPFEFISGHFNLGDQRSRTLLAGAGFPVERQNCPIKQFSPGQIARLGMLVLRLTEPNFYLLDEPTNHVDIPGQEKLESEIRTQQATCIVASHDRRFVENIGTRFLEIKNGKLIETG